MTHCRERNFALSAHTTHPPRDHASRLDVPPLGRLTVEMWPQKWISERKQSHPASQCVVCRTTQQLRIMYMYGLYEYR
jgi:hypothetical protein